MNYFPDFFLLVYIEDISFFVNRKSLNQLL